MTHKVIKIITRHMVSKILLSSFYSTVWILDRSSETDNDDDDARPLSKYSLK